MSNEPLPSQRVDYRDVHRELRRRARAADLLEPRPGAYGARAAVLVPLLATALAVAWHASGWMALAGSVAAGFFSVQIGFIAHDAGHAAVGRGRFANALAGHAAFTVINGLGFGTWCDSHAAHHHHSQEDGADPDMRIDTVLSVTHASAEAKQGLGRLLRPYQGDYLWLLPLAFALGLRGQSAVAAFRAPSRYRWDVVLLPLHYALFLGAPIWILGVAPGPAIGVYLAMSAVIGYYLALVFWVNHLGMPSFRLGDDVPYLVRQVLGTRNIRTSRLGDLLFGGLNHQIEHHLLPECPHTNLSAVRSIARPLIEESGLPYREETFATALVSVTRHVNRVARGGFDPVQSGVEKRSSSSSR